MQIYHFGMVNGCQNC